MDDFFDCFFELDAADPRFMAAGGAADPKIHAGAGDFPLIAAAGMIFFGLHDIADI